MVQYNKLYTVVTHSMDTHAGENWNNVINFWKKMEEEWFCYIQEANFHIIDK